MSQSPLVIKNLKSSGLDLLVPYKKAEVPAKNTNTGAQKLVIKRVKNKKGVVVYIFVGSPKKAL